MHALRTQAIQLQTLFPRTPRRTPIALTLMWRLVQTMAQQIWVSEIAVLMQAARTTPLILSISSGRGWG